MCVFPLFFLHPEQRVHFLHFWTGKSHIVLLYFSRGWINLREEKGGGREKNWQFTRKIGFSHLICEPGITFELRALFSAARLKEEGDFPLPQSAGPQALSCSSVVCYSLCCREEGMKISPSHLFLMTFTTGYCILFFSSVCFLSSLYDAQTMLR